MLPGRLPAALCVLAAVLGLAAAAAIDDNKRGAIVEITGGVQGNVTFVQIGDGPVAIFGKITGLSPGSHGFHIHEKGDVSTGCAAAGGHFNPQNKTHGAPEDVNRHVGDLGNIVADANGVAEIRGEDRVISLMGPHGILDRAVVVHFLPDDLGKGGYADSLTTGHAGDRIGCGTIKIKFPAGPWTDNTPSSAASWRWSWALLLPSLLLALLA